MVQQISGLTLAVVTKDRPDKLDECLKSIFMQRLRPIRLLIIDNSQQKTAKKVYKKWHLKLKCLEYQNEQIQGIAAARNKALSLCKTSYLGFVDDDCILSKDWLNTAAYLVSNNNFDYCVGKTKPKTSGLLSNLFCEMNMKSNGKRTVFVTPKARNKGLLVYNQSLNTRSSLINMRFVRKYRLVFISSYNAYPTGGGEDTEFGLQIILHGGKDMYAPRLLVYHDEPDTIWKITIKAFYRGITQYITVSRWRAPVYRLSILVIKEWWRIIVAYSQKELKNESDKVLKIMIFIYYRFIHLIGFNFAMRKMEKKLPFGIYYFLKTTNKTELI